MGIDMKKMREKYAALKNRSQGGAKTNFWRPQDGDQVIRIVPTPDGDPFKDFWFHYNVGNAQGFLSPKRNFGEDDPLNDFVRELYNEGTEDSVKMAKELRARQRFFAPVVVRGEEDQGVRVWGFGRQVYEKILQTILDPDYGDITDVDAGFDLKLNYGKPAGASYPKTDITPRPRTSPLHKDSARQAELLDSVPDFSTLFPRKTPAEVQAILDEFLMAGSDPEDVSSETDRYSSETSKVEDVLSELGV